MQTNTRAREQIDPRYMNYNPNIEQFREGISDVYDNTRFIVNTTKFQKYNIYQSGLIRFAVLKDDDKYKNKMHAHVIVFYDKQTNELIVRPTSFGLFYWSDTEAYIVKHNGLGIHTFKKIATIYRWTPTNRIDFLKYLHAHDTQPLTQTQRQQQVCDNDDLKRFITEYL